VVYCSPTIIMDVAQPFIKCAAENFVGIKLLFLYFNSVLIVSKFLIQ